MKACKTRERLRKTKKDTDETTKLFFADQFILLGTLKMYKTDTPLGCLKKVHFMPHTMTYFYIYVYIKHKSIPLVLTIDPT